MALKSNLSDFTSMRQRLSKELPLPSSGVIGTPARTRIYPLTTHIFEYVSQNHSRDVLFEAAKRLCDVEDITKLPDGDVKAILFYAKGLANSGVIEYETKCPACDHKEVDSVPVEEFKLKTPDSATVTVTLGDSNDNVELGILTAGASLDVLDVPKSLCLSVIEASAVACLLSVNDGAPDDAKEAAAWFNALTIQDRKTATDAWQAHQPRMLTEVDIQCDSCGHQYKKFFALGYDFFAQTLLT